MFLRLMTRQASKNDDAAPAGERIAKVVARAGLCSRREAERWITLGRIAVDGKVLTSAAMNVGPEQQITVDGKPLPAAEAAQLWRYHKPRGQITSHRDPQGRPTVFQALPKELGRVLSVGRLDFNSEGLLLLTNDGALARHLEQPSTAWTRRYRARVHGRVSQEALDGLQNGVTISGIRYGPVQAKIDRVQGANAWLTIGLTEGKNREVRRICEHLGFDVTRLIRTAFGPFQLGDLPKGAVKRVTTRVLADQLGAKADDFGLNAPRGGDGQANKRKEAPRRGKRRDADHRR